MDLQEDIKELNALYTATLTPDDFCRIGFDINNIKINYENTMSLYELVSKFNELYLLFKRDYEKLEKLYLGKQIKLLDFDKCTYDTINYRFLEFFTKIPNICENKGIKLIISQREDEIITYVTNGLNPLDKRYFKIDIDLNKKKCKEYLNLFEKHKMFLDLYYHLENNGIFRASHTSLMTKIKGDILEGLETFHISSGFLLPEPDGMCIIETAFTLGENLQIDYNNCHICFETKSQLLEKEKVDEFLKDTYIHKKYLKK